jgi:hypothetical protein
MSSVLQAGMKNSLGRRHAFVEIVVPDLYDLSLLTGDIFIPKRIDVKQLADVAGTGFIVGAHKGCVAPHTADIDVGRKGRRQLNAA